MSRHIAHVALNIPKNNLFSYLIPLEFEKLIKPGHLVYVPLKKKKVYGLVVDITEYDSEEGSLKEIITIPYQLPVLDQSLIDLAKWMSDYYLCPLGITVRSLIPTGVMPERIFTKEGLEFFRPKGKEKSIIYINTIKSEKQLRQYITTYRKRAPKQCTLLERLLETGGKAPVYELSQDINAPLNVVQKLISKGYIRRIEERAFRDPYKDVKRLKEYNDLILTPHQEAALNGLFSHLQKGGFSPFLLYGITGSGKTEVYLRIVLKALEKGIQSIVLVPEISITHQLIERFKFCLHDRIAILHSHLSPGERLDEWFRIKNGLADVVIGARSAIFAPLPKLGIIICDEEHDSSYKQETPPRYNGRDVAIMRAKMTESLICLGSATPSLESYYNTQTRKYNLITLPKRVTAHPLPLVNMIDMREEFNNIEKGEDRPLPVFSKKLSQEIEKTLSKGEQVLIFQNRRGHSPFLLCPKCGYVPKCSNCSVSLTYHLTDRLMRCHYCDFQIPTLTFCPHCPGIQLKYIGHGTQKVEQQIRALFPKFAVARMDRDTTTKKGAHYNILSRLQRGETDILIGTQMVTKGLDLPNITLVGVVGVDYILNLPDFRAAERIFQMITQVAGRAGRGEEAGRVFVQTLYPEHYCLMFASKHDYISFYNREIGFRKRLLYPPYSRLICLIIKGNERKITREAARFLGKEIKINLNPKQVRCLGPSMAPLFRLKGFYRYQIMLKSKDYRISHALVKDAIFQFSKQKGFKGVKIEIDVDPVNLL